MKKIALAIALAAALTTMTYAGTPPQDQTSTKKPKKAKKTKKQPKKDAGSSTSK